MAECKKRVLAVVGPTASGKTALGVEIAKEFGGEVVSCDSMQIYKGIEIATAAPTPEEMQGIPHHLIGFRSPAEDFNVARYCTLARECIDDIISRGKLPVIVGGTGLYFNSLVDGIDFQQEENDGSYRLELRERCKNEGAQVLLDELAKIDPECAASLHVNNSGRIIRALEIYHNTGKTMSQSKADSRLGGSDIEPIIIGLDTADRNVLYDRINRRVDRMLENGLLEEAKRFYGVYGDTTATRAIGFKELQPYFDGEATLEECVEKLKLSTRHYAKRQLTWFRRDERIKFLKTDEYPSFEALCSAAFSVIKEGLG